MPKAQNELDAILSKKEHNKIKSDLYKVADDDLKPKQNAVLRLLRMVPLLSGLLRSFDTAGSTTSQMLVSNVSAVTDAAKTASAGFQFAAIGIAAMELLAFPVTFLGAWILGEKRPFNLTAAAKLSYLALMAGLVTAVVLFPPVAPILALIIPTLVLAVSVASLGKFFYERHQIIKELEAVKSDIPELMSQYQELKDEAGKMAESIDEPSFSKKEYRQLMEKFKDVKETIQQYEANKILISRMRWPVVLDKTVGIGMAAGVLGGIVLSVFFPPVGLSIATGFAISGGLYIIGRVGLAIGNGILSRSKGKKTEQEIQEEPQKEQNTTSTLLQQLIASNVVQLEKQQGRKQLNEQLTIYVENKQTDKIIYFFQEMAKHAEQHKSGQREISAHLLSFNEIQGALTQLKVAIPSLSIEHLAGLQRYKPFVDALKEEGVSNLDYVPKPIEEKEAAHIPHQGMQV